MKNDISSNNRGKNKPIPHGFLFQMNPGLGRNQQRANELEPNALRKRSDRSCSPDSLGPLGPIKCEGKSKTKPITRIRLLTALVHFLIPLAIAISRTSHSEQSEYVVQTPARICNLTNEDKWVTVSGLSHLLLFYGRGPTDLPTFTSGEFMLRALLDEPTAEKCFGKSPFVKTRHGLRYSTLNDPVFHSKAGESHSDQCLAAFADLNLPLSTCIHLRSGEYTILSLLAESEAQFSLDQHEPAWTAMAYVKYIPPNVTWTNRFGEKTSFSQLSQHLLKVDLASQSCDGTHILEALVRINNADSEHPLLDAETRNRVKAFITNRVCEIVELQNADGSWEKQWCESLRRTRGSLPPKEEGVCSMICG
jgi:hypothetical protein